MTLMSEDTYGDEEDEEDEEGEEGEEDEEDENQEDKIKINMKMKIFSGNFFYASGDKRILSDKS